jgi:adenosylcobinamide kinase/adenosylcobinamide-phosphate guanylyltransferase
MAELILILGGVRSGKSRFAQELAERRGGDSVLFVATAEAGDSEMVSRIAMHRRSRPAAWSTLERPMKLGEALAAASLQHKVVLVDCLTLLVSNLLLNCGDPPDANAAQQAIDDEIDGLLHCLERRPGTAILVSGEVGMGLVPENALGRLYRDLLGWVNQKVAKQTTATYLMIAGLPVDVRSLATTLGAEK